MHTFFRVSSTTLSTAMFGALMITAVPGVSLGRNQPPKSAGQAPASVQFFVPPLPSQGHRRDQPVSEWSYLDDTDSVFAVLTDGEASDTVVTTIHVYVQRIPWEG